MKKQKKAVKKLGKSAKSKKGGTAPGPVMGACMKKNGLMDVDGMSNKDLRKLCGTDDWNK